MEVHAPPKFTIDGDDEEEKITEEKSTKEKLADQKKTLVQVTKIDICKRQDVNLDDFALQKARK